MALLGEHLFYPRAEQTTDFNTDNNDCDGYLAAGNTLCTITMNNTATTMRCGCTGAAKCLTDTKVPDYRSYISFPTGQLNGAYVTSAILYYYVATITKTKFWIWDAGLDPKLEIVCRKNFIGDALSTSHWLIGVTQIEKAVPETEGIWYSQDVTAYIYNDGDTDICLRPNTDWNTDANNQGKNYILNITTNEGGANKPYLRVVYK